MSVSFHIVLYQPQIPPNTGNIIRLCANTGATLHLIEPMGFALDNARMKRAGLDYHEWADVRTHTSLEDCLAECAGRVWAFSTRGKRHYSDASYASGDVLLFGSETSGLPEWVHDDLPTEQILKLPMRAHSRSLNLANTVAVATYEVWRQLGFSGGQ